MLTFIKAQAASLTASLVDLLVTILLVRAFGVWYVSASIYGIICGGITYFTLCRNWVFEATTRKTALQIFKFVLVWNGNLLLNAAGLFLVTNYTGINYIVSKIMVSVLVGVSYNYLLQKYFVFNK